MDRSINKRTVPVTEQSTYPLLPTVLSAMISSDSSDLRLATAS